MSRNHYNDEESESSGDIDRDLDEVLATIPTATEEAIYIPSSFINPSKFLADIKDPDSIPYDQTTSIPANEIHSSNSSATDQSHAVDSIMQIDLLGNNHVRVHHGTVGVGKLHSVNDKRIDESQAVNIIDLIKLFILQPLHSLDVQPLPLASNETNITITEKEREKKWKQNEVEFHICFVHVPDGTLGVEMSHVCLTDLLLVLASATTPALQRMHGFRIERPMNMNTSSPLSIGDIIVAVNDTSIVSLPATTAASLLAESKSRKFTILKIINLRTTNNTLVLNNKPERVDEEASKYFKQRDETVQGRKRHRHFLREETQRKYNNTRDTKLKKYSRMSNIPSKNDILREEEENDDEDILQEIEYSQDTEDDNSDYQYNHPKGNPYRKSSHRRDYQNNYPPQRYGNEDFDEEKSNKNIGDQTNEENEEERYDRLLRQNQFFSTTPTTNVNDNLSQRDSQPDPHQQLCELRRTYLCHTLYKPVQDRYASTKYTLPTKFTDNTNSINAKSALSQLQDTNQFTEQYSEVLYRQKFLEAIHKNDASQNLKKLMLHTFTSNS